MIVNSVNNNIKTKTRKKELKMKTRKNYINNKDLYNELCKWRDSAERLEDRIPSEKLGEYFLLIARHMSQG